MPGELMIETLKCRIQSMNPLKIFSTLKIMWQRINGIRRDILWRTTPISRVFGFDRGKPIDRYYIYTFLCKNQSDLKGHVLEIGDSAYTKKFGESRVTKIDVLHAVVGNPQATIIGDLSTGIGIPENAFDCMILTQTFQFIYNTKNAIRYSYQALAPGGVLLATVSGISQIAMTWIDGEITIGSRHYPHKDFLKKYSLMVPFKQNHMGMY